MKAAAFWIVVFLGLLVGWLFVFEKFFNAIVASDGETAGGAMAFGALWGIFAAVLYRRLKDAVECLYLEAAKQRESVLGAKGK
jgi:hypothetical protein